MPGRDNRVRSSYEKWQEQEGVPVVSGYYIRDLAAVPVGPWRRMGAAGAFVNLEGTDDSNDAYILEIPAGCSTGAQRYLFEEVVYVVSGRGASSVWNSTGRKVNFEWKAGSLFTVPLNTFHQHFNASGLEPTRLFAVTTAPIVINLFHNLDFVFGVDFDFKDRFESSDRYFSGYGTSSPGRIWEGNFLPDVGTFPLQEWQERGAGGRNVLLELGENTLAAHISEFGVGTYKKAHRHGAGAHVIIISGEGYSLMWEEGTAKKRFDWHPGSVIVPPDMWFHQHFNIGSTPVRYLALRWGSKKYLMSSKSEYAKGADVSVKLGGNQIEYEDEDADVREMFSSALTARGVRNLMEDRPPPADS